MKALLFGARGQVGEAVQRTIPSGWEIESLASSDCDISDEQSVHDAVAAHQPYLIINAAAYTAVDKAESEPKLATAVNAHGPQYIAKAAASFSCRLIHLSTDFVFDGKASEPISPDTQPNPTSVYGASKLDGERAVLDVGTENTVILRTSWVYSRTGNNFVKTMLRLMAEREEIGVVSDQIGSPTWATGLAKAIWAFAGKQEVRGIFHWSDAGATSWFDFAVAIQQVALETGLLERNIPIKRIGTADYPTPARRPKYSVLDCTSTVDAIGCQPVRWRTNLELMLAELKT